MRATEFIIETQRGKPLDAHEKVSPGAAFTVDGFMDLYRASAVMAKCPGKLDNIDPYSYLTNRPMIITYTDEEQQMVKDAFKKMGIQYSEHMHRGSEEPEGINTQSPTFSGKVFGI